MVFVSQQRLYTLAAGLQARGLVDDAFVQRMRGGSQSPDDLKAMRQLERSLSSMTDSYLGESIARLTGWQPNDADRTRADQRQDVLAMRMVLEACFATRGSLVSAALQGLKNALT